MKKVKYNTKNLKLKLVQKTSDSEHERSEVQSTKGEQAFDEENRLRVGGNCVYRLVGVYSDKINLMSIEKAYD